MLPVTLSVPPFAFAVMSPICSASRANVTVPCKSVTARRGSRTTRPPFSNDIRPSRSGWSARPVTLTSSVARPVVATSGENAPSMRRSSVPSSMKSSAGESPVNERAAGDVNAISCTCPRPLEHLQPAGGEPQPGRAALVERDPRERELRALERQVRLDVSYVERGCRQRDDCIHSCGHVGKSALLDKRRERRRCDRAQSKNSARGLARLGQALDVPLGKRVCEHGRRHSARRRDGCILPGGPCLAKFEHAGFERRLQVDVGGRWNVAEAARGGRERDVGVYLGRSRMARDSHLEIDGAGRIEGVWSRHSNERYEIGDGPCQRDVQRLTCSRPLRQPAFRHERRVADPQLQVVGDHSITRVAQPGRAHETYRCAVD